VTAASAHLLRGSWRLSVRPANRVTRSRRQRFNYATASRRRTPSDDERTIRASSSVFAGNGWME